MVVLRLSIERLGRWKRAAAIAAAGYGLSVVLVDENPIPPETMGDDVPLHFGQRMSGAARNRTAMTEAMLASEPALADDPRFVSTLSRGLNNDALYGELARLLRMGTTEKWSALLTAADIPNGPANSLPDLLDEAYLRETSFFPPTEHPAEGEVLVRNLAMSVDPYMRGRMNDVKSYVPPFQLGQVLDGGAVGEVVSSTSDGLVPGDVVLHGLGWRDYALAPGRAFRKVDTSLAPASSYLGVLGMPGLTAYAGLFAVADMQPGETVFVSGAAGAVGSLVGQLARLSGCRVIGTAGGPEKAKALVDELGFHAGIDYRAGNLEGALRAAAPDGIDVYFDNVGGDHLQAALAVLNPFGRIAACGMISGYNEPQPGPDNLFLVVGKKLSIRGFIVSDHAHRTAAFERHVTPLLAAGQIVYPETVVEGIAQTFGAFVGMLHGSSHTGKLVVRVALSER